MPHFTDASSLLEVVPLPPDLRLNSLLGAEVRLNGADLSQLSTKDEDKLREGLYEHSVLIVRNAGVEDGTVLPKLCSIFDENNTSSHSYRTAVQEPRNILSLNGACRLSKAPDVGIIGNGTFDDYRGIPTLTLKHLTQSSFHASPLSGQEIADGQTRFYRWHMDAPLYERLPGKVTVISCRVTPSHLPDQKIVFTNGKEKKIPAGGTAYISGARAFSLLTAEEKQWAMNTKVQYAPRAYNWIRDCKATSDGITIESQAKETPFEDLEPWTWDQVHTYPLVWRNPGKPNRPHLLALGCCVYRLITTDPDTGKETIIEDIREVRGKIHGLLKRVMSPEYVYVHRYEPGDLVIWHNRGLLHSITGELGDEKRLMWQASQGSYDDPEAAKWDEVDLEGSSWNHDVHISAV